MSGVSSAITVRSMVFVAAPPSTAPHAATMAWTHRAVPVGPTTVAQPVLLDLGIAVVGMGSAAMAPNNVMWEAVTRAVAILIMVVPR